MKSDYTLEVSPYFQMKGSDFNKLLNSVKRELEEGVDVKVALTVRTSQSNLVLTRETSILTKENSVVFKMPVLPYKETEGAFSVLLSLQALVDQQLHLTGNDIVNNTVLIPIGAYEENNCIIIYYHLIIKDELIDSLSSNDSFNFQNIKEVKLNNTNPESIIVLSTLKEVE